VHTVAESFELGEPQTFKSDAFEIAESESASGWKTSRGAQLCEEHQNPETTSVT
jgi:hypothetical protein